MRARRPPPRPRRSGSWRSTRSRPTRSPTSASARSRSARSLGGDDRSGRRGCGACRRLAALAPERPEPRAARDAQPGARALRARPGSRGHRAMRRLGMKVAETRPAQRRRDRRETRAIGALIGSRRAADAAGRPQSRPTSPRAKRGIRKRPRVLRDPRRRAHALRDARQLAGAATSSASAGGRLLTDGLTRRAAARADLRRDRGQAQPGHHHRRPARHRRSDMPKLAAYLPQQPGLARHEGGAQAAGSTSSTGNSLLQP